LETPKEKAAEVLFSLLNAECKLAERGSHLSEIHDEDDPKVIDAYCNLLRQAAKPVIAYLETRGHCNGVAFPFDV
jgi:hypothetical protein